MKNKAIKYYKENVEGVPLTQDEVIEAFCSGFLCREKETEKVLRDTLNKYKSLYKEETQPKLFRTPNYEKMVSYQAFIEVIEEIKNKLK
jgi:hypothetical protein